MYESNTHSVYRILVGNENYCSKLIKQLAPKERKGALIETKV